MSKLNLTKLGDLEQAIKIGKDINKLKEIKQKLQKKGVSSVTARVTYDAYNRCDTVLHLSTSLILNDLDKQMEDKLEELSKLGFEI